ncbi:hypothetical protein SAMN05216516_10520 [Izhakiella capsodis]|uniref:Dit-like phage tail protein N-terminal domain-containing protein n=1 Tax=Izhakiella capsodis TaxID=1367852 RepID=A0A1I4XWM3_9GAMM|nr:hypothetical protein [Izhakiella capsodis]SFN29660.1 hypothetical protein SAMN05216516_10520 [Izhakiella capsodis]
MSIIDLNTADIFNAIGGGSPLSIIDSALHPQYVIRDSKTGSVALEFSGMSSIQPEGRAQITTAPVEKGQYQSINKVKDPATVRCEIIVSGLTGFSGSIPNIFDLTFTSQSSVLRTLKSMLETANTYDIETPKETLTSYDLVEHSYEVNSQHGVTMLRIYLYFQEVIQQMEVTLSGAQADKKPTKDEISKGANGTGDAQKEGASKPATVDDLSKSWSSLKESVKDIAQKITDPITSGFQSALDTVKTASVDVAASATKKASELVKNISENLTGPGSK